MVDIIRNKWCEDLHDILQCPICFECPKTLVHQCINGHHICESCKRGLAECPTCKQSWSLLRNRVAEELCSKLDDIKLSLANPDDTINKLLLPDTFCVATQTDARMDVVPAGPSGSYPCCIGNCNKNLCFEQLMDHIMNAHFMNFIELPLHDDDIVFQRSWPLEFMRILQFDRAFRIPRVGTFFIKLSTNESGELTGFVSMIHSASVAKQFAYQLKIECCMDRRSAEYTGDVKSCRTPLSGLAHKCLRVQSMNLKPMAPIKLLKCNLTLAKKLQDDVDRKKKVKRPRNRNNAAKAPTMNGSRA